MGADWSSLEELPGTPSVRVSAGFADRAVMLQGLVRDAHDYLSRGLETDFAPEVVVPDPADWSLGEEEAPPYGIPYASDHGFELVIPADPSENFLVDTYAEFVTRESATRFTDLIAVHELGHLHVRALGLDLPLGWLGELLATYLSCCFLADERPDDAALWYALSRAHAEGVTPEYRSLEVLDELYFGVGPDSYVWYQSTFSLMVERVQPELGLDFVRRLAAAGLGPESDGPTMLAAAESVYPGFDAWARSLR